MKKAVIIVPAMAALVFVAACGGGGNNTPSQSLGSPSPGATLTRTLTATPQPYVYSPDTYEAKLASCHSDPNGATVEVRETTRRFIVLPKAIYPFDPYAHYFVTVSGNAMAGYISNGGPPGNAYGSTPDCWSTYYEFAGSGEVDLKAKSELAGARLTIFYVSSSPDSGDAPHSQQR